MTSILSDETYELNQKIKKRLKENCAKLFYKLHADEKDSLPNKFYRVVAITL